MDAETDKNIVLDANILIRAVLGKKVRSLLERFSGSVQFYTPEVCFEDAQKYLPLLFEKRNLPVEDMLYTQGYVSTMVTSVPKKLYSRYEASAKRRMESRDIDDWPIVATALLLNCPVWTEDSDFFGSGVATWTTDRVHLFFDS
jgi:predicted nucleic acid-binding protein